MVRKLDVHIKLLGTFKEYYFQVVIPLRRYSQVMKTVLLERAHLKECLYLFVSKALRIKYFKRQHIHFQCLLRRAGLLALNLFLIVNF